MKRMIFFFMCIASLTLYWQLFSKMDYEKVLHLNSSHVFENQHDYQSQKGYILAEKSTNIVEDIH